MTLGLTQQDIYRELSRIIEPINPEKDRFSCVGYAPSKHRRCWNVVNGADVSSFDQHLRGFNEAELKHPEARSRKLRILAGLGLCVRYHRKTQITEVASKWDRAIALWLSRREASQQQSPRTSESHGRAVSVAATSSHTRTRNTNSHRPSTPQTSTVIRQETRIRQSEEIIEAVEHTSSLGSASRERTQFNFTSERQPAAVSPPRPPEAARHPTRILTSPPRIAAAHAGQTEAMPTSARTSSTQTPRTAPSRAQSTVPPAATPVEQPSPVASPRVSSVRSESSRARESERCTQQHARRKTIDDDCAICQFSMTSNDLAELVWCKAQCGTNFHRECWETWKRHRRSVAPNSPLACVYWYAFYLRTH